MGNAPPISVQERVRLVYLVFLVATCASCAYCMILGQFNGDFFPQPVYLSTSRLLLILIACLAPYLVAWHIAGLLDRIPPRQVYKVPTKPLFGLLLVGFTAHMAATVMFGVGVMDQEVYNAPALVLPLIQVLNRLDPFYLGAFFILATPKRAPSDLLVAALMVLTGFLRAGLGAFNYVAIALAAKYSIEIIRLFRRMPWLVITAAMLVPTTISALYELRGQLRGDMQQDLSIWELLFGRFVGRLSAFSNVAYIDQNSQTFRWVSSILEPFFYVKQGMVALLGSGFAPTITPERLLIAGTQSYEGFSSFLAGIPGNLVMAWYVSPWVAVLNLFTMLGSVTTILWLSRYLGNESARVFGLGMLFYPLTSGVANEFSQLLLDTFFFVGFTMIFGGAEPNEAPAR